MTKSLMFLKRNYVHISLTGLMLLPLTKIVSLVLTPILNIDYVAFICISMLIGSMICFFLSFLGTLQWK